eukprot:TRINITY_DN5573_c0_g1_i2.p1 TRINITY_DN5573_c0_g1~~TRINITY_DN5573_c0_g1_i2.p1  ORF type:complete len:216 (-),score=30.55 TRINITY_DN5573_c0_g1_i2:10-657(-)
MFSVAVTDSKDREKERTKWLEWKRLGNEAYQSGDFLKSVDLYTKAITYNPVLPTDTKTITQLWCNRAAAFLRLGSFKDALADANHCITLDVNQGKAWERKAVALYHLGYIDESMHAHIQSFSLGRDATESFIRMVREQIDPYHENRLTAAVQKEMEQSTSFFQNPFENELVHRSVPCTCIQQSQDPNFSYYYKMSEIGRAVQQECRDRSRMPSSA